MRIAISGAGIAGPTAAYWLQRSGHIPTLIERAPALRTGGYVIDFWGVGYRIAQLMGIEHDVLDAGYRVRKLRGVRSNGHSFANVDVDAFVRAVDGRYVTIARSDLAAIIYSSIADDVEVIFDDTVTDIDNRSDGVTVSFERHPAREFDLILGADGLHSAVRELTFGSEGTEHYLGCCVGAFTTDGYRPRDELTYVLYNVPGAQVGRFALRDDRTLFLFVFRHPDPHSVDDARALLRARFDGVGWECRPILARLDSATDLYFDAVSQIRLDRWSRGRVALLGDAAAAVSFLAGEGTGLAMLEAYVLAGELARATGDHRIAFAAYDERLRMFIADKQRAAYRYLPFFAGTTRLGLSLRNLGLRAMSIPGLAERLASRSFRDDIDLPDYGM
ncbi:FAD-binding domain [Mycobacterium sp. 21AC1]|uniref:FAD-binding domain n=1 Tax=[Mycobacterium] appelbergii TaxID=2939269 RepID=UPI002938D206|nr:FAD-binding domain [Mycobacterium sp. 21AC1]MDV3125217.1 FAD-binding domain [Mycobacterium sp. 21AC1]